MSGLAARRERSWFSALARGKVLSAPAAVLDLLREMMERGPKRVQPRPDLRIPDDWRMRPLWVRPRTGGPKKHPRGRWAHERREQRRLARRGGR